MVPVCKNAWSGDSRDSYVHLRCQRLFDGWPKLSLQSAATSLWLPAKFSWTVSLDESYIANTCVITTQSDLNKAAVYWLRAVLHIPHKDIEFSAYSFVSLCSRLSYITKEWFGCDDNCPYACAFQMMWCPATKLVLIQMQLYNEGLLEMTGLHRWDLHSYLWMPSTAERKQCQQNPIVLCTHNNCTTCRDR